MISEWVSHLLTGWRDDHGPTNVGAMVKIHIILIQSHHSTPGVEIQAPLMKKHTNWFMDQWLWDVIIISLYLPNFSPSSETNQIMQRVILFAVLPQTSPSCSSIEVVWSECNVSWARIKMGTYIWQTRWSFTIPLIFPPLCTVGWFISASQNTHIRAYKLQLLVSLRFKK